MRKSIIIGVKQMGVVLLAFTITAVFHSCKRAAEKTSEKIIEKSMGDDANIDIDDEKMVIETDEGTFTTDATIHSWPKELPSDVPEFKEGKVISVTTHEMDDNKNWVVIFEDVPQTALQKYKEELETEGFKINYTTTAGTGGHLTAEKGKLTVVVMVGEGNATVTVGSDQ
ncbi:hypothetical protein [Maribacter halichondriae]|uniref:hypothetical protein n=1 Tax=Maribacter halichondriae TaxID=2980554 RepID=UPI002359DB41|nr:hypothetical protein [Maribacter sp. Hal144]